MHPQWTYSQMDYESIATRSRRNSTAESRFIAINLLLKGKNYNEIEKYEFGHDIPSVNSLDEFLDSSRTFLHLEKLTKRCFGTSKLRLMACFYSLFEKVNSRLDGWMHELLQTKIDSDKNKN